MTKNESKDGEECPYCGEQFSDSVEEGIHRTNEHVEPDPIPRDKDDDVDEENSLLHNYREKTQDQKRRGAQ